VSGGTILAKERIDNIRTSVWVTSASFSLSIL
jgi:hypothetical protein